MITKHPQNGSSKSISTLKLAVGQQGKLMKMQLGQLWRSNIDQLFLFLSIAWNFLQFGSRTRQGIVEAVYTRLFTGKICEPTKVEKMDRSSCVRVGKDPGLHSVA